MDTTTTTANTFWAHIKRGATRLVAFCNVRMGGAGTYGPHRQVAPTLRSRRWTSGDGSLVLDIISNTDSGEIQSINCIVG